MTLIFGIVFFVLAKFGFPVITEMVDKRAKHIEQSLQDAAKWFLKAAEAGLPDAQFNVALMYENGLGTDQDPTETGKWLARAAEQGFEPALQHITRMYNKR